jgi:L-cysteine/cystine lyase
MTDTKIQAIRAALPAVERYTYLNNGTNGPLSRPAHHAIIDYAAMQLEDGRIRMANWERFFQAMTETRAAFSDLLGCDPLELALTHSTTEGMNIALMGLDWRPGDELITASTEHEGGLNPCALIRHRYGVTVHYTDIGLTGVDPLAELQRVLNERTKAVVLSHASWATGAILPMREISEMAHRVGALVICDAAQSCGMVPTNVRDLGVDAYACSGQKWLCGPEGTGALFVRQDRLDQFQPSYFGYFGLKSRVKSADDPFIVSDGARRYEAATLYPPSVAGLGATLKWIKEEVGWDWAYERIRQLGAYCHDTLAATPGVQMYCPKSEVVGLMHFTVDGIAPADLTMGLMERGVLIRHTPFPELNRVATGFYNTEEDIDRLVAAIADIRTNL